MSTEPSATEEATVRGTIPEADRADMTFEVQVAFIGSIVRPMEGKDE